jgi:hypothetical protein
LVYANDAGAEALGFGSADGVVGRWAIYLMIEVGPFFGQVDKFELFSSEYVTFNADGTASLDWRWDAIDTQPTPAIS